MTTLQKIGIFIKEERTKRRLSQEQFCTRCGIDQHYISNIENGQRNISIDVIERISRFLDMSLSNFFTAVENIKETKEESVCFVSEHRLKNTSSQIGFERYMRQQGLSERTITKYSSTTANCLDVQKIVRSVTGTTQNMFDVRNLRQLEEIIEEVHISDFDIIGHSMYSAGLKKYMAYLTSL